MKLCTMFYGLGLWFGMWYLIDFALNQHNIMEVYLAAAFYIVGKLVEKLEG